MVNRGHALSRDELIRTLTAYTGITTADGAGDGTTLIDSALIDNPYISPSGIPEKAVLIMSGAARGEDKGAGSFNNVNGTITLQGTGFSAQIMRGTIYRILNISSVEIDVENINTKIGTPTDAGDLPTLFGRHLRAYLGTHTHALVVVHDTSTLDPDLDTALQQWLLDLGLVVTLADPTDVAGNLEVSAFDVMVVSASCVAGDVAGLANLNPAEVPIICHSADIAASVVFSLGGTPHTHGGQTQIEIIDNTPMWLITQALGDLTVTAAANIYAMNTKAAAAVTLAEEATATGNHLTIVRLLAGYDNAAAIPYAAFYDRYFVGVGDYTNMNAVWKAVMAELIMHCVMEKRFTEEVAVKAKGIYVEDIPGTGFALAAIDTVLTNPPPAADAANSIVDLDQKNKTTYVLRSWWVNVTNFGTGTQLTFQLWVLLNGVVTLVDSVVVNALGIQNLMDIFGLPEVHADGIWITVITDVGTTGACSGTFRYAEAKK